jgi:predicted cobalt transporter CbtA
VFHTVATEPRIDDAIAIEEAAAAEAAEEPGHAGDEGHEDEVSVSRSDQRGAGLFAAYALTGAAFGLFLAITSLSLRTTSGGPFRRVVVSGTVLAGAITVAPWLKYPPNPPAVGNPDTVGERERLYVMMIVLAALLLAGAAHLSGRLRSAGWPDDRRGATVAAVVLVAFGTLFAAMPSSPDSIGVPANLVWQFRINSLTGNLLVWTLLTLGLGVAWTEAARRSAAAAGATVGARDQNSMPFSAEIPAS